MKALWFFEKVLCFLAVFAALAPADSIQLRNGRHLQGKFVGGTATAIEFMTDRTIEYFATSDVLMLVFDSNPDSPLSIQPSGKDGDSPSRLRESPRQTDVRTTSSPGRSGRVSAGTTSVTE